MSSQRPAEGPDETEAWLRPHSEQEGLKRYVETLRERLGFILAIVALTTGLSILYVLLASPTYEAEADLLVTPVADSDAAVQGLPLIRESSDPTRDVETAARLVTTTEVAERVQRELGIEGNPEDLLSDVTAEPVAQSNIVAVTATADTPEEAQALANSFAEQAVKNRTRQLHETIDDLLPTLKQSQGQDSFTVQDQISRLEQLRAGVDPTMSLETPAVLPTSKASPRPLRSVAAGIFAGLVLGITGAFALQGLDPRLRREEQLRRLYKLPILARIPRDPNSGNSPLGPRGASAATLEAYRTLRGTVAAATHDRSGSRAILVTGSSPSEGKTTTAINLASALAASGKRVILIEADLRRPKIGAVIGEEARFGVVSVLIESVTLENAVIGAPDYGPNLKFLLADYEGGSISELFALPSALELIDRARELADFVIVDSPPLTDVVDALPLTRHVDDVLLVVGIGRTRLNKLAQLGELLASNDIRPIGFAVVGTQPPSRTDSSYYIDERKQVPVGAAGGSSSGD